MTYLIIFAAIISIIGLIITIFAGLNADDSSYSTTKSFNNLSFIYIILIPVILIVAFFVVILL
ncbi:hypothetical protein BTS2_2719 [Bacillus sp. TS-2]|nr:hypothetical protein BTS2_2719 [Bacillus sp. TS-2]